MLMLTVNKYRSLGETGVFHIFGALAMLLILAGLYLLAGWHEELEASKDEIISLRSRVEALELKVGIAELRK